MLAFAALGQEARRAAPDGEERLLHRVLGERLVAQDPQREAVGGAAVAVVELGERGLVGAGERAHERLVGEVGEGSRRHAAGVSLIVPDSGRVAFGSDVEPVRASPANGCSTRRPPTTPTAVEKGR